MRARRKKQLGMILKKGLIIIEIIRKFLSVDQSAKKKNKNKKMMQF